MAGQDDGGIYFSNNDGSVFADKTNGMVISQMYKLGVSQLDPDEIITGLQDNGTKLLSAGNWDDVKGGDGMECIIDFTDVNIQYGTYVRGQISRTTNHWASSTAIEPASAGNGAWVTPYIIDPADNNTLYAGYANVWKTTNKGNSWTEISSMNTSNKIRSMAIAPSNSLVLYVADYSHIWSTTNGGNSWTEITGSLPVASSDLRSIAVKNDDPNTLWVTLSYYNTNAVYESTDGGSIWTNISNGLPEIPAYSIVQNAQVSSEVHLYVGTELGVYFKKGDDNWIEYNTGLPKVKVGELEIYYAANAIDSKLRMASYGRGLWETPMELENTDLPTVQTATPTDITDNSATVGGNVTNEGLSSVNERGVVWSTLANPTVADNKIIHGSTGTGAYSSSLIGLNSSTIYHTRAYAINTQGISYGGNQEFTTLCNTFSLPFAEGFESGVFPPNCWATYRGTNGLGTSYDWEESSDSQEGTKAAYVRYENVSGGLAEDWLVSPSITIEANTELSFFQKQEYSSDYGSMFYIKVSTTSQTDHASFSTLSSWGETGLTLLYSEKIIDLSAYAGQNIYLAFVFVNDNGDNWFIDNINITSSSITPTATITATPGCNTGTVTVTSDLSGIQTFYLTQDDGTVITSQTADATSIDFTGLADGTYRGKVEKAGQMSSLSSAVILVNNTNPAQPSAISGNTNPCEGTSETYSVTNVAGVSYAWSLPTGWTGSSTTNSITVTVGSASGDISVTPSNSCGNGAVRALAVTAENVPAQTSIITGNTNPCEGTSEIYSVTNVAGVTYAWSLPTGWAGSSTTNTITVTVGSGSGDILVTPSNSCGNGAVRALAVTAENVPAQTSIITGNTNPCEGTSETYSVTNVAGVSYAWSLPTGWTGSSTTNTITVTVGSGSGDVSVTPSNSCGDGTASMLGISVDNLPAQPSAISGNTNPCEGTSETYSVTNVAGVSYAWSLPTGWTGSSTTNTITVTVGPGSGDISVTPSNSCGDGIARVLAVTAESVPAQPSAISGNTNPCEGTSETYSVTNVAGVSYTWSLPTGWTGSSTTNSITVTVGTEDGELSVFASNTCGSSPISSAILDVEGIPDAPTSISGPSEVIETEIAIYEVGEVVDAENYEWELDPSWILENGAGTTQVTISFPLGSNSGVLSVFAENDCGQSGVSEMEIEISPIGVAENLESLNINMYPNPTKGLLKIELNQIIQNAVQIQVLTLTGKLVHQSKMKAGNHQINLDLSSLAPGSYIIGFDHNLTNRKFKIVITK
ncbi:MAG: hypothetical protein B7C24_10255 [Bacteroidetes bacterium 4572_77]|nr:MAG: hypothetical protein B7C24_10255 [Bacteroidetes bacterium 4572_77]